MSRLAFPVSPRRVRTALPWSMKDLRILKEWSLPTYHACKPYANSEGVYPFVLARPVPGEFLHWNHRKSREGCDQHEGWKLWGLNCLNQFHPADGIWASHPR